jgi:protocadherin Fat 1/2/3
VALNNLDTLRSYGSAGDELENFPPDYLRNLNRSTPVPPPSLILANPVGGNATGSDTDSLHKPSWQEQMQLASFITDTTKIKNGECHPARPAKERDSLAPYANRLRSFLF